MRGAFRPIRSSISLWSPKCLIIQHWHRLWNITQIKFDWFIILNCASSFYLLDLPFSKFYPYCSLVLIKIWWILFDYICSLRHSAQELKFFCYLFCAFFQKHRGFQQFFSGLSLILVVAAFNQFAQFVLHFEDFTMNVYKDMKYKLQSIYNDYKDKNKF